MNEVIFIVIGMALVTYFPRMLSTVAFSQVDLPEYLLDWLKLIPVAILSSLLILNVLAPEGTVFLSIRNPFILASIPVFVVAFKTRNLTISVLCGIITMAILNLL